jgi:hypothetical protein
VNTYEILDDGRVSVNGTIPVLAGQPRKDLTTELRLYGAAIAEKAAEYGVPFPQLVGLAHGEGVIPVARNRGIPEEEAQNIVSEDGGHGVFQITNEGLKKDASGRHLSSAEILDLDINADIAARYIRTIRGGPAGDDLVRIAATYNAGSLRPPKIVTPWPFHTFRPNYIDEVVAANNTVITEGLSPPGGVRRLATKLLRIFGLVVIAASAGFVAYEASKR